MNNTTNIDTLASIWGVACVPVKYAAQKKYKAPF